MNNTRTLTNMKRAIFQALAVTTLAILPTVAQAVPIAGDLAISGRVRVTQENIDFYLTSDPTNEFGVLDSTPGDYFDSLPLFSTGDALDLNLVAQPPGPAGFAPLVNFLTFDADPGLSFTLTGIAECTLNCFGGSPIIVTPSGVFLNPFSATQESNGQGGFNSQISIQVRGTVQDTTGGDGVSNFTGSYTATFTGQSLADLILDFTADGQIDAGYDAEILVTASPTEVPEPATLLTFGAGTALLAAHRRRRAKKAAQQ